MRLHTENVLYRGLNVAFMEHGKYLLLKKINKPETKTLPVNKVLWCLLSGKI